MKNLLMVWLKKMKKLFKYIFHELYANLEVELVYIFSLQFLKYFKAEISL